MSVRDLLEKSRKKHTGDRAIPIEHLFDEEEYAQITPTASYINAGDTGFAHNRDVWRETLDVDLAQEEEDKAQGRARQSARVQSSVDIDNVATCLARYKDFSDAEGRGVPLEMLAEILQCSWVENPLL